MKLGILVNTDRHPGHVTGITRAAISRGHDVIIFTMDDGTKLLSNPDVCALGKLQGVQMTYCRLSAKQSGMVTEGPPEIGEGSQYNNARMVHFADRVIVL